LSSTIILQPLIFYYSKTGRTAKIAEIVLPTIKAESRKIVEPGDWRDKLRIKRYSHAEQELAKANAAIVEFDPIILLTAISKGKPPSSMIEFLEQINLRGKRVILGLVGAEETNPKAVDKLRSKVMERGSRFLTTIYLRGVITGPDWIDLGEEDFTREAAKLAELVFTVSEVPT
jgi:flavodoxin